MPRGVMTFGTWSLRIYHDGNRVVRDYMGTLRGIDLMRRLYREKVSPRRARARLEEDVRPR